MARTALPGRLKRGASGAGDAVANRDRCRHPRDETSREDVSRLVPAPSPHRAGQHYVVRLTAPDGYTASRSYSVASAPDGSAEIELTVERLEGGEVSSFLHDDVVVGDELEVRGPIGGWFVWDGDSPLLVGGGSGVVPLMAMLRFARRHAKSDLVRLVVSVRTPDDLYYANELPGPESSVVYTRIAPAGSPDPWSARRGRHRRVRSGPRPRSCAARPASATPRPIS